MEERVGPSHRPHLALNALPLELQLDIVSRLTYPDALALKLTSRHFHVLVRQSYSLSVISRVTWLLSRAQMNLPIPKTGQLRLRSDADFLQNKEVQGILARRVKHEECADVWRELSAGEEWPGCLVGTGVKLCEAGVGILEARGGKRPTWTCNGGLVFVSERMVRDWEAWRRVKLRSRGGNGVVNRAMDWVGVEPWRLCRSVRWSGSVWDIVLCHVVFALLVLFFAVYFGLVKSYSTTELQLQRNLLGAAG